MKRSGYSMHIPHSRCGLSPRPLYPLWQTPRSTDKPNGIRGRSRLRFALIPITYIPGDAGDHRRYYWKISHLPMDSSRVNERGIVLTPQSVMYLHRRSFPASSIGCRRENTGITALGQRIREFCQCINANIGQAAPTLSHIIRF